MLGALAMAGVLAAISPGHIDPASIMGCWDLASDPVNGSNGLCFDGRATVESTHFSPLSPNGTIEEGLSDSGRYHFWGGLLVLIDEDPLDGWFLGWSEVRCEATLSETTLTLSRCDGDGFTYQAKSAHGLPDMTFARGSI